MLPCCIQFEYMLHNEKNIQSNRQRCGNINCNEGMKIEETEVEKNNIWMVLIKMKLFTNEFPRIIFGSFFFFFWIIPIKLSIEVKWIYSERNFSMNWKSHSAFHAVQSFDGMWHKKVNGEKGQWLNKCAILFSFFYEIVRLWVSVLQSFTQYHILVLIVALWIYDIYEYCENKSCHNFKNDS